jgi:hypothetical protein
MALLLLNMPLSRPARYKMDGRTAAVRILKYAYRRLFEFAPSRRADRPILREAVDCAGSVKGNDFSHAPKSRKATWASAPAGRFFFNEFRNFQRFSRRNPLVVVGTAQIIAATGADELATVAAEALAAVGADLAMVFHVRRFPNGRETRM